MHCARPSADQVLLRGSCHVLPVANFGSSHFGSRLFGSSTAGQPVRCTLAGPPSAGPLVAAQQPAAPSPLRGMSNGDWCCRLCRGPDGQPWRNWASKTACHKCKVHKGEAFLSLVPKSGSPTISKKHGATAGGAKGQREVEIAKLKVELAQAQADIRKMAKWGVGRQAGGRGEKRGGGRLTPSTTTSGNGPN